MEFLKIFYAAVGAPSYPILSLIIVAILGASASGGFWLFIGKLYEKEQEEQQKSVTADAIKVGVGTVAPVNQTGVSAGIINGNVTVNTTVAAQPHKAEARDKEAIYQAGIIVGKAFGARRLPTDATVFEFVEITHASQLNPAELIRYQDLSLKILTIDTMIGMMSTRPEDGKILQKVTAKIVTTAIAK